MRKALPIVVVLAIVAAAIVFFYQRKGSNFDMPTGLAADLAPADTILFLEAGDIARTKERWKETSLAKIAQEPEWQEFTKNWDAFVSENSMLKQAFGVLGEIEKADPAGVFLAMTSFEGGNPKIVGGFPYRGKKSDVEGVVRQLKEQLVTFWPAAKSELSVYEGIEVETLKDPQFTAAMAYHENWFFFATDTELLLKTLSRYLKKPDAPAALAKDGLFTSSEDKGSKDPDLRVWARWAVFADKLAALGAMAGGGAPDVKDPNPPQAITYTWKLDGPLMRDRVYLQLKEAPKMEPLANRSLAFTNPNTYAYLATTLDAQEEQIKEALKGLATMGMTKQFDDALATKGLKLEDIFTSFGPETAVMSAWLPGGIALPDVFAAIEVKDAAKAKLLADLIAENMGTSEEVTMRTEGETTIWTLEGEVPFLKPTLAVNAKHLMFALNRTALHDGMKQLATSGPNLATAEGSAYPAALKTVAPPAGMLLYVDIKTLFERLYDKLKPMAAMALAGNKPVGEHFDAGKLPAAETISRHLQPTVLSMGIEGEGWLLEGTGSLSLINMYAVAIPGAFLGMRAAPMGGPPTATFGSAQEVQAATDVQMITTWLDLYEVTNGAYPSQEQGLGVLVTKPTTEPAPKNWSQITPQLPTDPWGNPYRYVVPATRSGEKFDIFSAGPDRQDGTEDDIGNW